MGKRKKVFRESMRSVRKSKPVNLKANQFKSEYEYIKYKNNMKPFNIISNTLSL